MEQTNSHTPTAEQMIAADNTTLIKRIMDSDIFYSFIRSPLIVIAAMLCLTLIFSAFFAPWLAPYDPFDQTTLSLWAANLPPLSTDEDGLFYLLGTDNQGRDILSAIMYGMRTSLIVGLAAVAFALVLGTSLGLVAAFFGGWIDSLLMRIADIQLSFPAILVALLIDGVAKAVLGTSQMESLAIYVLILAIGLSEWVQFARAVRAAALVEQRKEYVQAARIMGVPVPYIMLRHILPNVVSPILVIATISIAVAIITEATLSFLGVGIPQTEPSLGTLIRVGGNYLMSGEWWITLFPGFTLVLLVLSFNLLGDWLRDALNPRLK
ncbi:MAG: ABC transporter permease [Pseudomonadales bacterium]|nr:ABC transporter permease [Pseudomonadales bacterium]NRA16209.1 ABC transporter permease [Oceanospirillaceae bacterium]